MKPDIWHWVCVPDANTVCVAVFSKMVYDVASFVSRDRLGEYALMPQQVIGYSQHEQHLEVAHSTCSSFSTPSSMEVKLKYEISFKSCPYVLTSIFPSS